MRRKLTNELINWKTNKRNKPLIIYGARQVGKTYIVREFAKTNYEYLYEINFEFDKNAKELFKGNLTIDNLYMQLLFFPLHYLTLHLFYHQQHIEHILLDLYR